MGWLVPDRVFDGHDLRDGLALLLADGRVAEIAAASTLPSAEAVVRLPGTIAPGFLDLQVNGGGDVLFNQEPTPGGLARIAAAHREFGTTGILPTVITDAPEVLDRAADAVLAAFGTPGVLGIHIEGPHIGPTRRGTHSASHVRPFDDRTMTIVRRLRDAEVPVMITLAPEAASAEQIAALAATGAVVSLGHSDATAEETRAALAAGARCFTHLFNAMSPMLNRAPGVVGAAINSAAHCGIICDGIHVDFEMVGLAIRARPVPDRMFLVSDAMPTVGGGAHFDLYGQRITVRDNRLTNAEGSLAGAHVTMLTSVRNLVAQVGIGEAEALAMATRVPAELMQGITRGNWLEAAAIGDLVVIDADYAGARPLDTVLALGDSRATA